MTGASATQYLGELGIFHRLRWRFSSPDGLEWCFSILLAMILGYVHASNRGRGNSCHYLGSWHCPRSSLAMLQLMMGYQLQQRACSSSAPKQQHPRVECQPYRSLSSWSGPGASRSPSWLKWYPKSAIYLNLLLYFSKFTSNLGKAKGGSFQKRGSL